MFEFEEAGGLHDVFLNRHAVSRGQNIFHDFRAPNVHKKFQDGGLQFRSRTPSQPATSIVVVRSGHRHSIYRGADISSSNLGVINTMNESTWFISEWNISRLLISGCPWGSLNIRISKQRNLIMKTISYRDYQKYFVLISFFAPSEYLVIQHIKNLIGAS